MIKIKDKFIPLFRECLKKYKPEWLYLVDTDELIELSPEQKDFIREFLTEELCSTGLNTNDEPNERGLAIEDLIDVIGIPFD